MSKETGIALGKLRLKLTRQPYPQMFSRVLCVVLSHVNRDKLIAWPSQKTIAQQVGCSVKAVKRNLDAAKQLGLITIESVGADELRQRTGYTKVTPGRRYTIYRINMSNNLWDADPATIREANERIRISSHKGITMRCNPEARLARLK
jgi:hypothetical protein